ncbi:hypothetical protein [Winkia neuii]|uniref:hypothetical protein n=1 Tax=Winkia neuii TaxID=33007 RepID=UPI0025522143|nr:hypothetical protein [Winkia neuii]MDK8099784.1 hypothetical protein [Winkia neuii]
MATTKGHGFTPTGRGFRHFLHLVGFVALMPCFIVPATALADQPPSPTATESDVHRKSEHSGSSNGEAGPAAPTGAQAGKEHKGAGVDGHPQGDSVSAEPADPSSPKSHLSPKSDPKDRTRLEADPHPRTPREITPSADADALPENGYGSLATNESGPGTGGASSASKSVSPGSLAGNPAQAIPDAGSAPSANPRPKTIVPKRSNSKTEPDGAGGQTATSDRPHVVLPTTSVEEPAPWYFDADLLIVGFIGLSLAGLIGLGIGMKIPGWRKKVRR